MALKHEVLFAIKHNNLELLKKILEGHTKEQYIMYLSLKLACREGHLKIVKYLVSLGVDITIQDNHALYLAMQGRHIEVVKYLESCGADIISIGIILINNFQKDDSIETIKYLLNKGIKANINNNLNHNKLIESLYLDGKFDLANNILDLKGSNDIELYKKLKKIEVNSKNFHKLIKNNYKDIIIFTQCNS